VGRLSSRVCLAAALLVGSAMPGLVGSAGAQFTFVTNNDAIILTGYGGPGGVVTIPSATNGYPVVSIQGAFNANSQVTSVIISHGITNITFATFGACLNLTNVVLPDTLISIGQNAFEQTGLGSVTLPASVANIGEAAFGYCQNLQALNVEAGNPYYTSASGVVFDTKLTSLVEYPSGRLGPYAVPDGVTNIALGAFWQGLLSSVTIPASLTGLASNAFYSCPNLTQVYFQGNAPSPANNGSVFSGDPSGLIAYYLPGATGWGPTFYGVPTESWNPKATALNTGGGQFGFNITGPPNATIVVVAATDLSNPVWLPVSTNTLSGSGTSSFSDPEWMNYPNRYYRFRSR